VLRTCLEKMLSLSLMWLLAVAYSTKPEMLAGSFSEEPGDRK